MGTRPFYSRIQSRQMFQQIQSTIALRAAEARQAAEFRGSDPFEQAKNYLQRRGFSVFSESLYKPGSKLIRVGQRALTREQVIEMAQRHREELNARSHPS